MGRNLAGIARLIPANKAERHRGVIVDDGNGVLSVNVGGNILPCTFLDPVTLQDGDACNVQIYNGEAVVTGRLVDAPRPSSGTVKTVPPSSNTITVTGSDGVDYDAYFVQSYTPTVGHIVALSWSAGNATVTGRYGATPAPQAVKSAPVATAPTAPSTGSNTYAATDSGTWTPGLGLWDHWRGGGGHVYQGGSAYGYANYGAWFYGGSPGQLKGRTITGINFTLGSRFAVGNYNSPVVVHFYLHTSARKPGGDVSRTSGPFNVTIPAGSGIRTFGLPASWGTTLLNGGGIAIAGEDYAGFNGRFSQPASGTLKLYWSR